MVKIISIVLPAIIVGGASAFAPTSKQLFSRHLFAEEEAVETPIPPPPAVVSSPDESESPGGALVPIKEETIEFTAGLIGGAVGFAIGGPVIAAIGAAAANYASKTEMEIGEVVQAVSKSSIEVYNYLATLDAKYEVLNKAKTSLQDSLEKVKANPNVDEETAKKVEAALESTSKKVDEINKEYDLVGAGNTALGVIGDLVEKAVKKAGELNEEYKLSDKALDAVKGAVDKAKAVAK